MTTSVRPLKLVIFSAATLFTVTAWGDQIYRWTGADGATHFSETPPDADPGITARRSMWPKPSNQAGWKESV